MLLQSSAVAEDWVYKIQPGDNLWALTRKFLKSMHLWPQLQTINGITKPRALPPGTEIRVPMEWLKIEPGSARVIDAHGQVLTISQGRKTSKIAIGAVLKTGTIIETDKQANVTLQFEDGSVFQLKEDSKAKLEKLQVYPGTGMVDTRLKVDKGKSESRAAPKKGPGSRFEIKTPAAIAGVRGTVFRIGARGDIARAEVTEGVVDVQSVGPPLLVEKGFGTVAKAGEPPLPPVKLLPAPQLDGLPSHFDTLPFYLYFPPLPSAQGYRIEIAPDQLFTRLLFSEEFPVHSVAVTDLPDGRFHLRISGIDDKGLEGNYGYHAFSVNAYPPPPSPIHPVAGVGVSIDLPELRWRPSGQAFGYHLQLAKDADFKHSLLDLPHLTETRYPLKNPLTPGRYYWRVAALDDHQQPGPWSWTASFWQEPVPPQIELVKQNGQPAAFRWKEPDAPLLYQIQIAWDPEFDIIVVEEQTRTPFYPLPKLAPGRYFIRIRALASDRAGPFSPPYQFQIPSPP